MKKTLLFILLPLILLFGIYWFLNVSPAEDGFSSALPSIKPPDFVFYDVSISEIYLGNKLWKINANKALLYKKQTTFLKPDIRFFRRTKPYLRITAPKAKLNMHTRDIVVHQPQSRFLAAPAANLTAGALYWSHRAKALTAKKNVIFTTRGLRLKADEITFNDQAQKLLAQGNIVASSARVTLNGKSCAYLLTEQKTQLKTGTALLNGDIFLAAASIDSSPGKVTAYPEVKLRWAKGISGRADRLVYNRINKSLLLKGNVSAVHSNIKLESDQLIAERDYLKLTGDVRLQKKDLKATAAQAYYFPASRKVALSGDCQVWKGKDFVSSEKIQIMLNTHKIIASQPESERSGTGNNNRRTKIKIDPEILFKK
ncbi:LptA/OstA family protein [Candidatus Margulisiibacteriota bacterium]